MYTDIQLLKTYSCADLEGGRGPPGKYKFIKSTQ